MIRIVLVEPAFGKQDLPDGSHALVFVDQKTGIEIVIPCQTDDLLKLKAAMSGIAVATP